LAGLIAALAGVVPGVLGRRARREKRLRPPGALNGEAFERACIRCFLCAEVCPVQCIRFENELDSLGADTPFLEARSRGCTLCMKCTQACPTGALRPLPFDKVVIQREVRMGRPVLTRSQCLPWRNEGVCRLCYYACPYADSAVVLVGPQQAPSFDPKQCVGCGLCEEACPETARAIRIEPLGSSA
jgi:MauM/NapG family ferredoxin protein